MEIESIAKWGAPTKINTKQGNRILRKASASSTFWDLWRDNKDTLRAAGVSVSKNNNGYWEVCWWMPNTETDKHQKESLTASRAVDANLEIPVPENLSYLPYQRGGIAYAMSRPATLIADEMGLGKTIQAIGRINADETIKSVLIICPASLKINWKRECQKWLTRTFSIEIANGEFPTSDIVIVNYDILKKHKAAIKTRSWECLIVDECHYIKNGKAIRTKQVLAINAKIKLFLTGTPICNRPAELWTLVNALDPNGIGKSWKGYHQRYCAAYKTRFGWDVSGSSNLNELQDKLRATIMVRRLKSEVLKELPAKQRIIRELPRNGAEKILQKQDKMNAEQSAEKAKLAAKVELARASGNKAAYESAVETLRNYGQVAFTEMSKMRHDVGVAKIPAVVAHLQNCLEDNDNQIVVFAHHTDVIDGIVEALQKAEISVVSLTGSTTQENRQKAVDDFQAGKARVFVGNIKAAGVGITLTASSHVIMAELDWVPGNVSQAEDRCHRIGQTDSVLIEHLVFDGSLDVTMAQALIDKQDVIDKALNTEHETEDIETPELITDVELLSPIEKAEKNIKIPEKEYKEESEKLTPEQIELAHTAMKILAGLDYDYAKEKNDMGFNRYDVEIGHTLAETGALSARQAVLARKLAKKYHRQLPVELLEKL